MGRYIERVCLSTHPCFLGWHAAEGTGGAKVAQLECTLGDKHVLKLQVPVSDWRVARVQHMDSPVATISVGKQGEMVPKDTCHADRLDSLDNLHERLEDLALRQEAAIQLAANGHQVATCAVCKHAPPPGARRGLALTMVHKKRGARNNAKLVCTITMLKQDLEQDATTSNLE